MEQPRRRRPTDRLKTIEQIRQEAAALDLRRQKQISNQIEAINRITTGWTYDEEMSALHARLADTQVRLDDALATIARLEEERDG